MLLQTNSYVVPKDRRSEHARLLRKFRQTLTRLGCESFEVYEQVGPNWAPGEATGRFVQIMRFRDRAQQLEVQEAEKRDPQAQQLIQEFCALINFPYQQQQGLFAVGFYTSALPVAPARQAQPGRPPVQTAPLEPTAASEAPAPEQQATQATEQSSEPQDQPSSLLRLTPDADDVIEAEAPPAGQSNGEHTAPFADTPSGDEPLTEADREQILGELTGDDADNPSEPDDTRRDDARSHAN
jgi:hypothetical protein